MLPFQLAFGFASSFVPYYGGNLFTFKSYYCTSTSLFFCKTVFGTLVPDTVGKTYIGFLSAIIVLTGAAMAIPASALVTLTTDVEFMREFIVFWGRTG